jgi:hypothetical protein
VLQAKKTANAWKTVDLHLRQLSGELPPPARLASLKHVVRKGIPYEMRPEQWFLMSGAAARQQEAAVNGQTYASLSDINSLSKNTLLTGASFRMKYSNQCRSFADHIISGLLEPVGASFAAQAMGQSHGQSSGAMKGCMDH